MTTIKELTNDLPDCYKDVFVFIEELQIRIKRLEAINKGLMSLLNDAMASPTRYNETRARFDEESG